MAGYICEFGSAWDDAIYTACPCCQDGQVISEVTTVTIPKVEYQRLQADSKRLAELLAERAVYMEAR